MKSNTERKHTKEQVLGRTMDSASEEADLQYKEAPTVGKENGQVGTEKSVGGILGRRRTSLKWTQH